MIIFWEIAAVGAECLGPLLLLGAYALGQYMVTPRYL
jgi:hypothetical protein